MNEHVTGDPWPAKDDRNARLDESVDIIRRLLAGEYVSHDGHVRVHEARVWSRPGQSAAAARRRGQRRDRGLARRLGGRPRDRGAVPRRAPRGRRRVPRHRRPGAGRPAGARLARADGCRGPRHREGSVAQRARVAAASAGTSSSPRTSTRRRANPSDDGDARGGARRRRRRRTGRADRRPRARSGSTASTSTTSARTRSGSCERAEARAAPAAEGGIVKITDTSDLWWKTAVIYCLDVETTWTATATGSATSPARAAHRLSRRPRRDVPLAHER